MAGFLFPTLLGNSHQKLRYKSCHLDFLHVPRKILQNPLRGRKVISEPILTSQEAPFDNDLQSASEKAAGTVPLAKIGSLVIIDRWQPPLASRRASVLYEEPLSRCQYNNLSRSFGIRGTNNGA
jgi:hypothetical protein